MQGDLQVLRDRVQVQVPPVSKAWECNEGCYCCEEISKVFIVAEHHHTLAESWQSRYTAVSEERARQLASDLGLHVMPTAFVNRVASALDLVADEEMTPTARRILHRVIDTMREEIKRERR